MDPQVSALIRRIEAYAASRGEAESTVSRRIFNSFNFITKLREGGNITIARLAAANRELDLLEAVERERGRRDGEVEMQSAS